MSDFIDDARLEELRKVASAGTGSNAEYGHVRLNDLNTSLDTIAAQRAEIERLEGENGIARAFLALSAQQTSLDEHSAKVLLDNADELYEADTALSQSEGEE